MTRLFLGFGLFLGMLFAASPAEAGDYGTLTGTYIGQAAGHSLGNGGRFDWRPVSTTPSDPGFDLQLVGGTLYTFCIELSEMVGSTQFDMNALVNAPNPGNGSLFTAAQAADIELLADNYWKLATTTGTALEAGAFQLALWEIAYGDYVAGAGSPIVGAGAAPASAYYTTAGLVDLANTWLQQLINKELVDNPSLMTIALVRNGKQDQITQVAVPEVSAIAVWSLFLGSVGFTLHHKKQLVTRS